MAGGSSSHKFKQILAALETTYGERERYKPHPPVEQALVTLLLRDGREAPALRSIQRLGREFVDWNEVRVSDPADLTTLLGTSAPPGAGPLIIRTLTAIFNHSQAMNLDDVMALGPQRAEAKLTHLDSLPSRVAAELLLANLQYEGLPGTPGMLRVARRTHILRGVPADAQARALGKIVPSSRIPRVVHAFETLAERVCTEENYDCRVCPIQGLCPTGIETLERIRQQEERGRAESEAAESRLRDQRVHERTVRARKRAATAQLKKAIQVRSKKLRIPTRKTRRRRRPHPAHIPPGTRMVQTPSDEVRLRPHRPRRRKAKPRRTPRPAHGTKR